MALGRWGGEETEESVTQAEKHINMYLPFVGRVMVGNNGNLPQPGKLSNCFNLLKIPSYSLICLQPEVSFPPTTACSQAESATKTTLLKGPWPVFIRKLEKRMLKWIC